MSVVELVWGVVHFFFGWLLEYFNPKHNLPHATPSRPPPDPSLFPRYMQNKQGIWLHWTEWSPRRQPTAVVFLVSGLAEHSGRYDSLGILLASQGYHVFALDHQGQGGSEGDRCYVERFSDYVDDMQLFVKKMLSQKAELSAAPRFLIGHSMGGLISTHLAFRDPGYWSGVVLSAPALEADPKVATPVMKFLAKTLSRYIPKLALDKLDLQKLSTNRAIVELARQDPYYPSVRMNARWGNEMLMAMEDVWTRVQSQATFPFVILHSKDDTICSIGGSRRFYSSAPSTDKALREYSGMLHELFTETRRHEVLTELQRFLQEHVAVKRK